MEELAPAPESGHMTLESLVSTYCRSGSKIKCLVQGEQNAARGRHDRLKVESKMSFVREGDS